MYPELLGIIKDLGELSNEIKNRGIMRRIIE